MNKIITLAIVTATSAFAQDYDSFVVRYIQDRQVSARTQQAFGDNEYLLRQHLEFSTRQRAMSEQQLRDDARMWARRNGLDY